VYNCVWCSALVVLAAVVWSWAASCVHCVKVPVRLVEQEPSHTTTVSTTSAEHHTQLYTILFS